MMMGEISASFMHYFRHCAEFLNMTVVGVDTEHRTDIGPVPTRGSIQLHTGNVQVC